MPTAAEQGLAGFHVETWFAVFGPKGVPDRVVKKLSAALNDALNTPPVQQRMQAMSNNVVAPERRSPEYLRKFLAGEVERWVKVITDAGVSLE